MRVSAELEAKCFALAGQEARPIERVADSVSEKQFMQAVCDLARRNGWKYFHCFDSRKSVAGFPDLTLAKGNRLIFAELKVQGGKLTAAQLDWLEVLGQTGVPALVWTPDDWPMIVQTLTGDASTRLDMAIG